MTDLNCFGIFKCQNRIVIALFSNYIRLHLFRRI